MATPAPLNVQARPVPLTVGTDGVVRMTGTRVPLETVVLTFEEGATAEEIVQRYSTLRLADVYAVIAYYLDHRAEVREYVAQREQAAAEVQRRMESMWPPEGIRERLLARRPRA